MLDHRQGCARVGKLLRELVVPAGNDSGRDGGDGMQGIGGVRTCLAIMQTSVGEELGEAFDQVIKSFTNQHLDAELFMMSGPGGLCALIINHDDAVLFVQVDVVVKESDKSYVLSQDGVRY
jgi:hypothetical protein